MLEQIKKLSRYRTYRAGLQNCRNIGHSSLIQYNLLEWPDIATVWSPCSIVRYLDSFSICLICLICSTVFRPCPHHLHWCCYRIWWLSPPHWTTLEWLILRQFSSPCSIVRYLDSFQVPARYARYARQFSSPCSIVRYLDSFQVPARYARYARQFLGLEWPILRQFWSPCSIVRYLNSFSICSSIPCVNTV